MMKTITITTFISANQYSDSPARTQDVSHRGHSRSGSLRTVYTDMDQLHCEYRDDDDQGPFPCLQLGRPVLAGR